MTDGFDPDVFGILARAATPAPWSYSDVIAGRHNVTRAGWEIASCSGAGAVDRHLAASRDAVFIAYVVTHRTEIAAALSQGQLVATPDQLNALPVGAVIREQGSNRPSGECPIYERGQSGWMSPGWELEVDYLVTLPATVLWMPAS